MRLARRHRWVAWLLPLFLLRAFVPVGFMWAPAQDGLQLVLCSGVVATPALPQVLASAQDHSHHATGHAQHDPGASESAHQISMCPFAAAGVGYMDGAALPTLASSVDVALVEAPHAALLLDRSPVSRHRIRGPPTLV